MRSPKLDCILPREKRHVNAACVEEQSVLYSPCFRANISTPCSATAMSTEASVIRATFSTSPGSLQFLHNLLELCFRFQALKFVVLLKSLRFCQPAPHGLTQIFNGLLLVASSRSRFCKQEHRPRVIPHSAHQLKTCFRLVKMPGLKLHLPTLNSLDPQTGKGARRNQALHFVLRV